MALVGYNREDYRRRLAGLDGAAVFRRAYGNQEAAWLELGVTPLYDIHVPLGPSVLRLEKPGYLPLQRVIGGGLTSGVDLPVEEVPEAPSIRRPSYPTCSHE